VRSTRAGRPVWKHQGVVNRDDASKGEKVR
jgi:hypothetical protein